MIDYEIILELDCDTVCMHDKMNDKGEKKICEIYAPDEDGRYLSIEHVC